MLKPDRIFWCTVRGKSKRLSNTDLRVVFHQLSLKMNFNGKNMISYTTNWIRSSHQEQLAFDNFLFWRALHISRLLIVCSSVSQQYLKLLMKV